MIDSVAQKLDHTPPLNGVQCSISQPCRLCRQFQTMDLTPRPRYGNPSVGIAMREQERRRRDEARKQAKRRGRR